MGYSWQTIVQTTLDAWRHQANTRANVDLPSIRLPNIYSRVTLICLFEHLTHQSPSGIWNLHIWNNSHISEGQRSKMFRTTQCISRVKLPFLDSVIMNGHTPKLSRIPTSLIHYQSSTMQSLILGNEYLITSHCWSRVYLSLMTAEWRIYASVIKPSFVQIMACRLVAAKPLPEPMLEYF